MSVAKNSLAISVLASSEYTMKFLIGESPAFLRMRYTSIDRDHVSAEPASKTIAWFIKRVRTMICALLSSSTN